MTPVERQLVTELETAASPWAAVLGPDLWEAITRRIRDRAPMLVAQLQQVDDDQLAANTVDDLMAVLGDREPKWFTTPLGRLVARSAGSPLPDCVSYSVAAAMLGVSRTRVQQLVDDGRIARCPTGSLRAMSVLEECLRRTQA